VKDRSELLPVPYEASVSHEQVEPFQRQMRKLSEALWLETPALKLTVSLISVACWPAVMVAEGRSSERRGLPEVVELTSTREPSFACRRERPPVER
jgi:hypothetical protein